MINLRQYYLDNSLRYSKWNYVPKRYVAAFAMLHQGEKITAIWSAFADLYHSNGTHKKGFDEFLKATFVLNGKGKILEYKDPCYEGLVLSEEYSFSHSLMNGIKNIESVLDLESFFDVDEETMRKMLNVKYEDLLSLPLINNCEINQNVFDFVVARENQWHESNNTYYPFIEFTFQVLYQCYKEINKRFIVTKSGKNKKNERIEAVILDSIAPISKSDIQELLPDVSITTIESVLAKLVKSNKIYKIGTFKNAKYLKR